MKKRIFSLLLVLALMASTGMTVFAEPDPAVEPAPQETAATTETTPPAEPEVSTETEAPVEPEVPAEVPAEPAPEGEPAADVPAAGEEVPGVDDAPAQDAAPAPNDGIATINEPAPASLPEVTDAPEATPDHRTVTLYANGGYFTGDHAGYDHFEKALEGDALPMTGGPEHKGEPGWYTPERPGYRFLGWYKEDEAVSPVEAEALKEGDNVPEEVTDLYAGWVRVVVLDAAPGSFTGESQNYTRTVDIKDGTLPFDTPVPAYKDNVDFLGWYTQKSLVTETPDGSGDHWTWSIEPQGNKIDAGNPVPEGVTTLYAGYQVKAEAAETQHVTYYLDWNGVDDMWGNCLTCTRLYSAEDGGYKLTAGDLAVRYLNWDGEDGTSFTSQEELDAYWKDKTFNGYTFLGWATTSDATEPDVKAGETVVANGQSIYAVWEKADGGNSWTFDRTEKPAGPLTHIRIISPLHDSRHANAGESMAVSVFCSPVGAVPANVTYTVTYTPSTGDVVDTLIKGRTMEVTVNGIKYIDGKGDTDPARGFDARIEGTSLVVTSNGQACTMLVSVKATAEDGTPAQTNGGDATLSFEHNVSGGWNRTKEPTCTGYGEETAYCATCEQTVTRKIYPTSHNFEFSTISEPTCTQEGIYGKVCRNVDKNTGEKCNTTYKEYLKEINDKYSTYKDTVLAPKGHSFKLMSTASSSVPGAPLLKEECQVCHEEETVLCGDVNDDGNVNIVDLYAIYSYVLGETSSMTKTLAGDVNVDGTTNIVDLYKVYSYVLGEVPSL